MANGTKAPPSIWGVMALALLGGSGGAVVIPMVRPQPFTLEDARTLEIDIMRRVAERVRLAKLEADIKLREVEAGIREDMPPDETKRRIEYLESMCRRLGLHHDIDCSPPSLRFSSQ